MILAVLVSAAKRWLASIEEVSIYISLLAGVEHVSICVVPPVVYVHALLTICVGVIWRKTGVTLR